jgi:hypothetical protein
MVLTLVFSCGTEAQGQVLGNNVSGGLGGPSRASRGTNTLSQFNRFSTSLDSMSNMNLSRQRNPLAVRDRGFQGNTPSLGISPRGIARLRSQQMVRRLPSGHLPSGRLPSNFARMLSGGPTMTSNQNPSRNTYFTGLQGLGAIRPVYSKPPEFFEVPELGTKLAQARSSRTLSQSRGLSQTTSLRREKSVFDRPYSLITFEIKK